MPCKRDRYDIKRIETDANSALLILGDRTVASLQSYRGAGEKQVGSEAQPINAVRADTLRGCSPAPRSAEKQYNRRKIIK